MAAEAGTSAPVPTFESMEDYVTRLGGKRAFRKVLIANNGIAAVKAIRSVRRWAYETFGDARLIQFVVMTTPEDLRANAEYIRMADEFREVPGGSNNNNYANVQLIVELAKGCGVDAVWAGWGHASENPALPDALAATEPRIAFIGPPAAPMQALGDKIGSTIIAQSAGVATIPWNGQGLTVRYAEEGIPDEVFEKANLRTAEAAKAAADVVGYPLMIKASEGGGGKGIRKVTDPANLESSFRQVQAEIRGSPIFLMQLAPQARHLEVQLLADEYGQAISLSGRDCSVQRRHQKIMEEGPVLAAPPDVWDRMERAAVRLAKEVGYVNAGTVEYLFRQATNEFAFLELNPRLQVEHPVTEMITGVNLPACQFQVSMGIPLHRIPDIRRLYGLNAYDSSEIDFDTAKQNPPRGHVIAARITAEDPEQGFQPTSGAVTELNFRSTPDVWGYFSVDSSGRVHEYADSQIGHLFSFGKTRDMARRQLVLALKELSIRGDIHTTVEYLVELLENKEYRTNLIDTSWLDMRIAANVGAKKPNPILVAMVGGIIRAHGAINQRLAEYRSCLERGQVPSESLLGVEEPVELIYDQVKYELHTSKSGPNTYIVACNSTYVEAEVRELSDGGYLILLGGKSHVAYSREEPSGLRLVLDGATCMFSNEYDPTQLRAAMSGKLARYLVDAGAHVDAGSPYAEVEVMKMYMQVTAPEAGTIDFCKPEGSILEPGELIATVVLDDPSKVHKAERFSGTLPNLDTVQQPGYFRKPHVVARSASTILQNVMQGYEIPLDKFEQVLCDRDAAFADPLLPFTEFEEVMSVLAGRLPFQLADKLKAIRETQMEALKQAKKAAAEAEGAAVAGRSAFDVSEIAAAVDEAEAAVPARDRAAFNATVAPLREFVAATRLGLDGANNANLLAFLEMFVQVETLFHGNRDEEVISDLRHHHSGDDLDRIYDIARSHFQLRQRNRLVMAVLSRVASVLDRAKYGPSADALRASAGPTTGPTDAAVVDAVTLPDLALPTVMRSACPPTALLPTLHKLAELGGAAYAEVSLEARQMLMVLQQPSLKERIREIETVLKSGGIVREFVPPPPSPIPTAPLPDSDKLGALVNADQITVGMITRFLSDEDQTLRMNAVQVYIRRLYRSYNLQRINSFEKRTTTGHFTGAKWTFKASDDSGGSARFVMSMGDSSDNLAALGSAAAAGRLRMQKASGVKRMGLSKLKESTYGYTPDTIRAGVLAVFTDFADLVRQFDQLMEVVGATQDAAIEAAGDKASPRTSPPGSPSKRSPACVNVLHIVLLSPPTMFDDMGLPTDAEGLAQSGAGAMAGAGAASRRRARSNSGVFNVGDDEKTDEEREAEMIDMLGSFLRARRSGLDSAGVRRATFLLPPSGSRQVGTTSAAAGAAGPPLGGLASLPTSSAAAGGRRRAGSGSARSHASVDTERQSAASFSRVYTFRHSMDFNEDTIVRHMEPPLAGHLELKRLANFKIRQIPTPNLSIHVYEAVPRREALEKARAIADGGAGGSGRNLEHVHKSQAKPPAAPPRRRQPARKRFFVRAIVLQTDRIASVKDVYEQYPGAERMFVEALNALNVAMGDALLDTSHTVGNNHIFLNVVPVARVNPAYIEAVIQRLAKRYADRLRRLRVAQVEFKIHAQFTETSPVVPVRLISTNPTGYVLNVDCYAEARDPDTHRSIFTSINVPQNDDVDGLEGDGLLGGGLGAFNMPKPSDSGIGAHQRRTSELDGKPVMTPYPVASRFERRRALAAAITDTLYVYDFLELFQRVLEVEWKAFARENPSQAVRRPARLMRATELVLAPRGTLARDLHAATTPDLPRGHNETISNEMGLYATRMRGALQTPKTGSAFTAGAGGAGAGAADGSDEDMVLTQVVRPAGRNNIGMVAWYLTLYTPGCPDGRDIVVIANDITVKAGSFGTAEDLLFAKASAFARERGIPRIYIAANSGARIGLAEEVKKAFRAAWVDEADVTKGFRYLYVNREDYDRLAASGSINATRIEDNGEERFVLKDIIGKDPDLGVENLRGSGTIAGETSRAYDDCFTLTYVTGRTVGIGAYLVRLGQRTIQKAESAPILLTGYQALNKLIGSSVYTSNQQLGGPKVMYANGVSHEIVHNDLEGIVSVVKWLAYVPRYRGGPLPILERENDVIDRPIGFTPKDNSYDPRHLLAGFVRTDPVDAAAAGAGAGSGAGADDSAARARSGTATSTADTWVPGFFDKGSFREYLASWAKTVVVGRARLGGIPMGVIIAETRAVETTMPADPAAPLSQETVTQQAGQVWYPDSAFKTAQAIRDFAGEELPLMIFANWRGFSGGQRDMFREVLKFGSDIVDALVAYRQPVFVYIPPAGELRGGAWVVVDSTINSACMEMYADTEARGGVLEPSGITAIKFRTNDLRAAAHRMDPELIKFDAQLKAAEEASGEDAARIRAQINLRERHLLGLYTQMSQSFADLHDRPGRMLAKGVVRKVVPWAESRRFFYWRLRRRRAMFSLRSRLIEAVPSLNQEAADDVLRKWFRQRMTTRGVATTGAAGDKVWDNDSTVLEWLSSSGDWLQAKQAALRRQYISEQIVKYGTEDAGAVVHGVLAMIDRLPADVREAVVGSLKRGVIFSNPMSGGAASGRSAGVPPGGLL